MYRISIFSGRRQKKLIGFPTLLLGVAFFVSTEICIAAQSQVPCYEEGATSPSSLLACVDPFIGTKGKANGFPGPQLPFGMVSLSPDCGDLTTNSGYRSEKSSDNTIRGFSHLHVSGTGGGPKYGVILLSPVQGDLDPSNYGSKNRSREQARPGYYSVHLDDYETTAELTTSHSVGVHRYTFPSSTDSGILLDVRHHLTQRVDLAEIYREDQTFEGGEVRLLSNREIAGFGKYKGGWNKGETYTVYFYAVFDTDAKSGGVWDKDEIRTTDFDTDAESNDVWDGKCPKDTKDKCADATPKERLGAFFSYDTTPDKPILVKVGISFRSVDKARQNIEREVPDWDFDKVLRSAESKWESVLSKVQVKVDPANRHNSADLVGLYSALYRSHLMPHDRTGEHPDPEWEPEADYFDDYYAIWDTYRTLHPLLTIIQPEMQSRMVQSLLHIYKHDGYLPDARSGNSNGRTQGGSNADILIADAFAKGLAGIDYELALEAMRKNAEVIPYPDDAEKHGRGGLLDFINKGYVSTDYNRSGTRTVEYSYNDFAIASVAAGLGKKRLAAKYLARSGNWKNLWNLGYSSFGFTGFIHPRDRKGKWSPGFSALEGRTWHDVFYEDNTWSYSLAIPHDVAGLIKKIGSPKLLSKRLDFLFDGHRQHSIRPELMFRIGNEPDFLTPYLYLWAGEPHKAAQRVTETLRTYFRSKPDGEPRLPGNDDAGALSSWYIFSSSGFYPLAGTDIYLVTRPGFPEISFSLSNGKRFTVKVRNYAPADKMPYIKKARLNGKELTRAWFRHSEIAQGGTLELVLAETPSDWATDPENVPPSGEKLLPSDIELQP